MIRPGTIRIIAKNAGQQNALVEPAAGNPAIAYRFDDHHFESKRFISNVPKEVFASISWAQDTIRAQ